MQVSVPRWLYRTYHGVLSVAWTLISLASATSLTVTLDGHRSVAAQVLIVLACAAFSIEHLNALTKDLRNHA